MIYVMEAAGLAVFKIGFSRDVVKRWTVLRCGSSVELVILGVAPGTRGTEGELHRRFAHLRQHLEWFREAPELRDFIATLDPPPAYKACDTWPATKSGGFSGKFDCLGCGDPFDRYSFPSQPPKYCSRTCANKSRGRRKISV